MTAGTNLKEIMKFKGVDMHRTISNDIHEVCDILGVEVARAAIMREISKVTNSQGLDIDEYCHRALHTGHHVLTTPEIIRR